MKYIYTILFILTLFIAGLGVRDGIKAGYENVNRITEVNNAEN